MLTYADLSMYGIGDEWWDLCAGPHVEDTGKIQAKALEIERVSGTTSLRQHTSAYVAYVSIYVSARDRARLRYY